jgi:hypothetical protein
MSTFLEKLSKEKLLGYFFILWGISFLISVLNLLPFYLAGGYTQTWQLSEFSSVSYISLGVFSSLLSLGEGIILILLGYKIIR